MVTPTACARSSSCVWPTVPPLPSAVLVTGVKRDIDLLGRVAGGAGDDCTVLDVSLDVNRAGLNALLAAGVRVRYFDHHFAGEIPAHPGLEAHIDLGPHGLHEPARRPLSRRAASGIWAIAGAFGDSLAEEARALAAGLGLPPADVGASARAGRGGELQRLRRNGGRPARAAPRPGRAKCWLSPIRWPSPTGSAAFRRLADGYREDMELAATVRANAAGGGRDPVRAARRRPGRAGPAARSPTISPRRTPAARWPSCRRSRRAAAWFPCACRASRRYRPRRSVALSPPEAAAGRRLASTTCRPRSSIASRRPSRRNSGAA